MTNVEQYINNDRHCFPPTNTDSLNIPKRCSRHLLVDKYLSEYKTELEKKLVMLNILLMDSVPKENSNRLVSSGTVYKVMREGKLGRDQLTELFNYLQRTKADKSELFNKDYRELINTPKNLSDFNNDLNFAQILNLENYYDKNEIDNIILNISLDNIDLSGYATQEYVLNQINNLIDGAPEALNTLKEITDKLSADGDIVNLILNLINEKANKSDVYTKIQLDNLLEIEQENISSKAENSDLLQTNELIQQLLNKILLLESKLENIKHEILTQEMYDNLQQYDPYTVYFIVEQLPPTPVDKNYWAFGDTFPVILAGNWKFGDSFPIILAGNWKFGDNFPIILSDPEIEYVEIAGVKWATKNLGAESITDPGLYFQWGDTKGYSIDLVNNGYKQFNKLDYKWEVSDNYIKYNNIDGKTILDSEDDAVTVIYGKNWSTPTIEDFELLLNSTNYETVINYLNSNMNGILFTDKLDNSKQLFFPMCGVISSGNNINLRFVYLSSSYKINSLIYALIGEFDPLIGIIINSDKNTSVNTRWYGSPVRGISKKKI